MVISKIACAFFTFNVSQLNRIGFEQKVIGTTLTVNFSITQNDKKLFVPYFGSWQKPNKYLEFRYIQLISNNGAMKCVCYISIINSSSSKMYDDPFFDVHNCSRFV